MSVISRFARAGGWLRIGGVSLGSIVRRVGTPLYVYDARIMAEQYARLRAAMPEAVSLHFAVKANPNITVARLFRELGAGAEIASAAELEACLAAGFKPRDIIYAGPGKGEEELRLAVRHGIGSINVESATELERVIAIARDLKRKRPQGVCLRVNVEAATGEGAGEIMTGGARKFGTDSSRIAPLVNKALAARRINFLGFHCYAGTGIRDANRLVAAYEAFARWAEAFARRKKLAIQVLNFGGGLGVPYADDESELDTNALGAALSGIHARLARSQNFEKARFILEPGRHLVGPAGVYVMRVTDLKVSHGRQYVITDGGIHHALLPIVMNKRYPTALVNRMDRRAAAACTIAGPLCAAADQFSREVSLPRPRIGDYVGVFNSGAYGYSAGMLAFLSHPTPAEVLALGGAAWLIRERRAPDMGVPPRCLRP